MELALLVVVALLVGTSVVLATRAGQLKAIAIEPREQYQPYSAREHVRSRAMRQQSGWYRKKDTGRSIWLKQW
jgi:hypothetical protein